MPLVNLKELVLKRDSYWSLIDTERICGHPGKKLPIMTPPEKKKRPISVHSS